MTTPSLDTKPHQSLSPRKLRPALYLLLGLAALPLAGCSGGTEPTETGTHTSEFDLPLPDLHVVTFLGGISGWGLLFIGMLICVAGFIFGLVSYMKLKSLPVHESMREMSELIYETCKAYLIQQGKFLMVLFAFIGSVIAVYFGFLNTSGGWARVVLVLMFAIIGMAGSYGIAWYGIRLNTFANSPDLVRRAGGQAVQGLRHSDAFGHERGHGADLDRVDPDARDHDVPAGATSPPPASWASRSASRWAPRRCVSPAASSPRSPISAPT